jgi:hypothetical protein
MAKGLESERRQIEAEEAKLKQRRERLADLERTEVAKRLAKSPLSRLSSDQIDSLSAALKTLGIAEVLKRLA